jgi:hypothetical protein
VKRIALGDILTRGVELHHDVGVGVGNLLLESGVGGVHHVAVVDIV